MSIKKKSLLACFIALALVLGITTAFATSAKPAETDGPYSEDFTDRDLYAQSSAETAALWEENLAPYEPFGLTWTFDDPDLDGNGLTMTWEGHEVRGIYDEGKFSWITEHAGDGAFGPDAVELYTIYENGKLTGLRLATEEEQKAFDRDRRLSADSLKVENLVESVRYDSGHIYFTIPESEEPWSIFIQGRILLEDGSGQSVRYLEKESEQAEWVPQMTYSFEVADAAYDELTMDVRYGNADYCYPLTPLLPENGPLPVEPLPEGKADIPEGTEMIWPVESDQINNSFGDRAKPGGEGVVTHTGVDIGGMEKGTPVYAAGKGTVKEAGFNAQDGNFVRIDHGRGQETFYAHCDSLLVKTGDAVTLGQTIATVGSTGQSTGPHLHFEFLVNGVATDPLAFSDENWGSPVKPFYASVGVPKDEGAATTWAGRPIIAIRNGTVLDAGVKKTGDLPGPYAEILYEGNYSMKFTACQSILVKTGDTVKAGDLIGYTGEGASGEGPSSPKDREVKAENDERKRQMMEEELVNGDYPHNSRGQTYGHDFFEYLGYSPDLIPVWSTNGSLGYASFVEMNGCDPVTRKKVEDSAAYKGGAIPVYDSEGDIIGEFIIEEGKSGGVPGDFSTPEEAKEAVANG